MTDADLIEASLGGHAQAFAHLVRRHQGVLCALAFSATGDLQLAEDITQETFVIAWRRLDRLRERDKFRGWLCGIARNVVRTTRRYRSRHDPRALETDRCADELPSVHPSPLEQVLGREGLRLAWRALQELPDNYREPLVLYHQLDESIEAVAECLSISEVAVRQRLSRARRHLRRNAELVERALPAARPRRDIAAAVTATLVLSSSRALAAPVIVRSPAPSMSAGTWVTRIMVSMSLGTAAVVIAAVALYAGQREASAARDGARADARAPVRMLAESRPVAPVGAPTSSELAQRRPLRGIVTIGAQQPARARGDIGAVAGTGVFGSGGAADRDAPSADGDAESADRRRRGHVRHGPISVRRGRLRGHVGPEGARSVSSGGRELMRPSLTLADLPF